MTITTKGEARLSAWMAENVFVSWIGQDRPWELEDGLPNSLPFVIGDSG